MTRDTVGGSAVNALPDPRLGALQALLELVPAWTVDALCAQVDPTIFFPVKGGSTKSAKKVCAACPVLEQCRDYVLTNESRGHDGAWAGIYGGMSGKDRRRWREEQKRAERQAS